MRNTILDLITYTGTCAVIFFAIYYGLAASTPLPV